MIDAPHGLTLHTTEAPTPDRRRKVAPPVLTVERGPRDAGRSGVTLDPMLDEDDGEGWAPFLADRRATFIQRRREEFAATERHILASCAEDVNACAKRHKHGPKAGRAERIAADRAGWIRFATETIEQQRAAMIADTTASPILAVADPETRAPDVYVRAAAGLAMVATVVEPQGQTIIVTVAGDLELQERVYTFLMDLSEERAAIRAVTT